MRALELKMKIMQKYKEFILGLFPKLSGSQKCYLVALMLIPFLLVWWIVRIPYMLPITGVWVLLLLTLGIAIDVLVVYNWLWSKRLGKALILIIYAVVLNLSIALSDQIVNDIVGNISSNLKYSISFISILLIPLFLAAAIAAAFIFIFTFGQIYLAVKILINDASKNEKLKNIVPTLSEVHPLKTSLFRFFVAIIIFPFYLTIAGHIFPLYAKGVYQASAFFIYNLQAYGKHTCEVSQPSKVILVDGNDVVIVTPSDSGYSFKNTECKSSNKSSKNDAQKTRASS